MISVRPFVSGIALSCCVVLAGEPAENPKPPQPPVTTPTQPVTPQVHAPTQPAVNPQQIVDWRPYLEDFQSPDKAKQEAATKIIIESGLRGYSALAGLLKNPNAEVAKRAGEVRQQIDMRSWKEFQDVSARREKMNSEPLTTQNLENLRQAWIKAGMYSSQNSLRQLEFQNANELQKTVQSVNEATKQLVELDKQLNGPPAAAGLARASTQIARGGALKTLQRYDEMLAAAQNAAEANGKDGRLLPSSLKLMAEAYAKKSDTKNVEATCRRILQEFPKSLEVKYAYKTLVEQLSTAKKFDDAIATVKAFVTLFPLDEEAQDSAYSLFETLSDEEHDYARVAVMAQWLSDTLPIDRLKPEIPKMLAGYNEYISKDFVAAAKGYIVLRDKFPDMIPADDIAKAISRVNTKAEGKFPKEPQESDAAPAGTFAKFLKAIRNNDPTSIKTLVPKDDVEDYVDEMKDGGGDKIAAITFADFIIKKVELNDKKDEATITLDYYEAASDKPREVTQQAVLEDGAWKIQWEDIEDADAAQQPQVKLQPAQGQPAPNAPIGPAPAPKAPIGPAPAPTPQK